MHVLSRSEGQHREYDLRNWLVIQSVLDVVKVFVTPAARTCNCTISIYKDTKLIGSVVLRRVKTPLLSSQQRTWL